MKQVKDSSSSQKLTEAKLTADTQKYLKMQKDTWFYKASDRYTSGIPDIIACVNGKFVAIELKGDGYHPTAVQTMKIGKIMSSGGIAGVCYSLEDVKNLVEQARAQ